jgi:crotonobetainyl-CoA:carnitine CoA-transferase CaiB-like acyl-CoA transferase
VSISGFGDAGPYAQKPVYDPLIQALSGLASIQGGSDQDRPRLVRTIVPDKLTGIVAAQAITAALLARERTGEGQHVRLAMLDAVVAFLWGSDMGSQTFVGGELPQQEAASFIDLIYETADDYISVAVQTDRQWTALTRVLERPEWLDDPRFRTTALRQTNINERLVMTQEVLRTRPAADWLERLTEAGVPCAPVLTRSGMISHPQVVANGIVVETDHPQAGRLRQARPAARFSATPAAIQRGAPALGEHTDEILAEIGVTA